MTAVAVLAPVCIAGLVGFAGAGHITNSFSKQGDNKSVPSYGAGVRFMVLQSKRINLRVEYARSDDSDALTVNHL